MKEDGYFAFFKLRCLFCLVLFLGLVVVDQETSLGENEKVKKTMHLLAQERITAEECMGLIK